MNEKNERKSRLPLWSKALIVMVLMVFAGSATGTVALALALKSRLDPAYNRAHIARLANEILGLPDPLPEGYSYYFGIDLWVFKHVTIDYKDGREQISIFLFNQASNPDEMVRTIFQSYGINTIRLGADFTRELGRGSWDLPGGRMPYIFGKIKEKSGKEHTGLVACSSNVKARRTILLYAVQPGETKSFDMRPCIDLLVDTR